MTGGIVPIIRRKKIILKFLNAGAINEENAVNPADIQIKQSFLFSRLESKKILVKTKNNNYYVDNTKI